MKTKHEFFPVLADFFFCDISAYVLSPIVWRAGHGFCASNCLLHLLFIFLVPLMLSLGCDLFLFLRDVKTLQVELVK